VKTNFYRLEKKNQVLPGCEWSKLKIYQLL